MSSGTHQLKLLTSHVPLHSFEAFPYGHYECSPAAETAMYYGFTPVKALRSTDIEPEVKKVIADQPHLLTGQNRERQLFNFLEKAQIIKMYRQNRIPELPHPLLLFYEKPLAKVQHTDDTFRHHCSLECVGAKGAVAEALIIQTSYAILEEEGLSNLTIEINSTGDAESRHRFEAALHQYIRSHLSVMPEQMREACRKNPYALFSFNDAFAEQLQEEAPQPISYLSESSRKHFCEVLEYLEALGLPYYINSSLLARKNLQSHTIFRILNSEPTAVNSAKDSGSKQKNELVSGYGMRYTPIARPLGFRREVPAVGAYLVYKTSLSSKRRSRKSKIRPRFSYVHLGFEAKLKSLQVIDMLRRKRIPLHHSLTKDRLSSQISAADRLSLPYLIIMGQKEALEDTVLIRNLQDRSQQTVPIKKLPYYLKTLK